MGVGEGTKKTKKIDYYCGEPVLIAHGSPKHLLDISERFELPFRSVLVGHIWGVLIQRQNINCPNFYFVSFRKGEASEMSMVSGMCSLHQFFHNFCACERWYPEEAALLFELFCYPFCVIRGGCLIRDDRRRHRGW